MNIDRTIRNLERDVDNNVVPVLKKFAATWGLTLNELQTAVNPEQRQRVVNALRKFEEALQEAKCERRISKERQ